MFVSVNSPGLGAIAPGYARTRYVRRGFRGLGQAASGAACPSLEQLLGITDATDPCQQTTVGSGIAATCYNTITGAPASCPISGNVMTTTPANTGPFGLPASSTSWLSQNSGVVWAIAAVLGVVLLAEVAK